MSERIRVFSAAKPSAAIKVGAFALVLAAVFTSSFWTGRTVGPVGPVAGTYDGDPAPGSAPSIPSGLQISEDGYTLARTMSEITPGEPTDFRFAVIGPDGRPVSRYGPVNGARLHLLVLRRDLTGFQHLYPAYAGGGQWSVKLTLAAAGTYRFLVHARPEAAARPLTLGTDVFAPGTARPYPLPRPEQVARVAGYEVRLTGSMAAGRARTLTFSISEHGRPVTGLQRRRGGLAVLRAGDLALLRTHRGRALGDGRGGTGPDLRFRIAPPSPGAYRVYLEFRHRDVNRTAEFTILAEQAGSISPDGPFPGEDAPHDH